MIQDHIPPHIYCSMFRIKLILYNYKTVCVKSLVFDFLQRFRLGAVATKQCKRFAGSFVNNLHYTLSTEDFIAALLMIRLNDSSVALR